MSDNLPDGDNKETDVLDEVLEDIAAIHLARTGDIADLDVEGTLDRLLNPDEYEDEGW